MTNEVREMTEEEAIERLEDGKRCNFGACDETCKYWTCHECQKVEWQTAQNEAHNMAISALEKQIPKKAKHIAYVDGGREAECPNCGHRICMVFGNGDTFRWQMPYCCDCGQRIDYEEEEQKNDNT